MFRSQGQGSTAIRRQRSSRTGRALVLETKHEADYTQYPLRGQTPIGRETASRLLYKYVTFQAPPGPGRRLRPVPPACRGRRPGPAGPCRNWCRAAIDPVGRSRSAARIVAATSSAVSIRSLATSIAPDQNVLARRAGRSIPAARASWRIRAKPARSADRASSGKVLSYWRHSSPRVFFQSLLALMP